MSDRAVGTGRASVPRGMAVAFVGLVVAVSAALYVSSQQDALRLYRAQVAACERGNVRATEINRLVGATGEFMLAAEIARRKSGSEQDMETARRYKQLRLGLHRVPLVDCSIIIEKP